jgi:hypothetical protein
MIREQILATEFVNKNIYSSEDVSIVFVSKDNRTLYLNVCSDKVERADHYIPKSIILTEAPLNNFKVISKIVSEAAYPSNLFSVGGRVIANSLKDKLKSFVILKEIKNCL